MKRRGTGSLLAFSAGGLAIGAAAALAAGRATLERRLSDEVALLYARRLPPEPPLVTDAALAGLPEPVQRWMRASDVLGRVTPSAVRLRYEGELRTSEQASWMPFTSQTYYTTNPPALLWTVQMRMFGVLPIVGRDRYFDGHGDIDMEVLSLVPVARASGGGLNQGALLRYLGETTWFPAAAIAPWITWQERDPDSAVATMRYAGEVGSLIFTLDAEGRLIQQVAAARYNDARRGMERWSTSVAAHGDVNGRQVPTRGAVVWNYATGDFEYLRWHLTDLEYDVPQRYP